MDRRIFYDRVRPMFGGRLRQEQVDGMNAILDNWDHRVRGGDLRWLAYMLATAFHETNQTMQPVREAYWLSEGWRQRNLRYYPYYGRGYVQLTWADNYRRAGQFVGADLLRQPDLAMDAGIAATVMFVGMQEGWFRGDGAGRQTLARYFNRTTDDPVGAREIINGREIKVIGGQRVLLATVIARYHAGFLQAMLAAPRGIAPTMPQVRGGVAPLLDDLPQAGLESGAQIPDLGDVAGFGLQDRGFGPLDAGFDSADTALDQDALIEHTVRIVTAYLGSNPLEATALPELITGVHYALAGLSRAVTMPAPEADALPAPSPAPSRSRGTAPRRARAASRQDETAEPTP